MYARMHARTYTHMHAQSHVQAHTHIHDGRTNEPTPTLTSTYRFKSGLLPLTDGTTLRTFLSKLLNCDPMRISKKFVGSNCIGKQVGCPSVYMDVGVGAGVVWV